MRDKDKMHTIFLLSLMLIGSVSGCQQFQNIFHHTYRNEPLNKVHTCEEKCMSKAVEEKVFGTLFYTPDSLICRAALHAGVLGPMGGQVQIYQYYTSELFKLVGNVRHRVISKSSEIRLTNYYTFNLTNQWIPRNLNEGSWLADVTLVHNSYNRNSSKDQSAWLWATCLYEGEIESDSFYRWDFEKFMDATINKKEYPIKRINYILKTFSNLRINQCLGKNHFMDVKAIFSRIEDEYATENITYRGIRGQQLEIKFAKFKGTPVAFRRIPDNFETLRNFTKTTIFSQFGDADSGDFIVGEQSYDGNKLVSRNAEQMGAYFQAYIQDCEFGNYGQPCEKQCNCQNNGVCHPKIGTCICRPGFNGQNCGKTCDLGYFGSNCQFSCTSYDLGDGMDVRKEPSCIGLIFCLPEPFGCSCADGYKGKFCEEYEDFPSYKQDFQLSLEDHNVVVSFSPWNPQLLDGGRDYGFKYINYFVELKAVDNSYPELKPITSSRKEQELIVTFENIREDTLYEVNFWVEFPIVMKDGNRQPRDQKSKQLSLPCLTSSEVSTNQTTNWVEISFAVPSKRIGQLHCYCQLINVFKPAVHCSVPENHPNATCKIEGLEPGTNYTAETWCENENGRCKKTESLVETLIDIQKLVNFENCTISLKEHHYFGHPYYYNLTVVKIIDENNWRAFKSNISEYGTLSNDWRRKNRQSLLQHQSVMDLKQWIPWEQGYKYTIEICKNQVSFMIGVVFTYKYKGLEIVSVTSISTDGELVSTTATYVLVTLSILILLFAIVFILKRKHDGKSIYPNLEKLNIGRKRFSNLGNQLINEANLGPGAKPVRLRLPSQQSQDHNLPKGTKASPGLPGVSSNQAFPNPIYADMESKSVTFAEKVEEVQYINVEESNLAMPDIEKLLNGLIYSAKTTDQFNSVPLDWGKPIEIGKDPHNALKNRFRNNLPYDDSRVVLSTLETDPYSDYINASFVKGVHPNKWYIACQGPKDKNINTIGDFWRMVIEMDVTTIAMVANFIENDKVKVGRYFNKDEELIIDDMTITVVESTEFTHFLRTEIQVSYDYDSKIVVHYQFIKWPDHGTPTQVYPICSMMKVIFDEMAEGTMVIHCSAGIGRTGSVLFVILLKELLEQSSTIDPVFILKHLRECRARLVENIQQYNFSLEVFYYLLFSEKGLMYLENFADDLKIMREDCIQLYKDLKTQPINLPYNIGQNSYTIALNRNRAVLPSDMHIVSGTSITEYINAIFVDLEDVRRALIVTEHPLPSTLYRFWQMIVKKRCSSLIFINDYEPSELFPSPYSLGEETAVRENFSIDIQQSETELYEHISCYGVTISIDEATHFLEVYQVHNWPRKEEVPSDLSILESISCIIQRTAQTKTPAVLCCSDGVTGCGFVASALNVLSHMQLYQEISIFYIALKMRRYRPQFIKSQRQFLALYEVASSFVQNNSHYQNFA